MTEPDQPEPGRDLVHIVADEALVFGEPLIRAATNPWARARLLRALGWDLAAATGWDAAKLDDWLAGVADAAGAVVTIVEDPGDLDFDKLRRVIDQAQRLSKLGSLPPLATGQVPDPQVLADMGIDLLTFLTVNRLFAASPVTYRILVLLGLITPAADAEPSPPAPADPAKPPIRLSRRRDRLNLDLLVDLLTDPVKALRSVYAPGGITSQADADLTASILFPRVAALLRELGVPARYGIDSDLADRLTEAGVAISGHMLSVEGRIAAGAFRFLIGGSVALRHLPPDGGPAVILVPRLEAGVSAVLGRFRFDLDVAGTPPAALEISEAGFVVRGGGGSLTVTAGVARLPDREGFALRLGPAAGTHLGVGQLGLAGSVTVGTGRDDVSVALRAGDGEIVIRAGDGDTFLKKVLPENGLRVGFALGVGWSRLGGLTIEGGASMAVTLGVHQALGPVELQSIFLAVEGDTRRRLIRLTAALTAKLEIGTFKAVVERIGVTGTLSFPAGGGAVGAVTPSLAFKPPDGLAVSLKAGPVTGGGYLFIDQDKGRYAGALELGFQEFKLAALGLLNTKMPDGSPIRDAAGAEIWSFIVVAAAQWKPVHIMFGIHIAGAGLVVGIHRTADVEALRAGVRSKALDAVLFPPDPVGNAPNLLATLGTLFPVAPGRFTFGLMGRFTWGPGTWLSLELGLILEIPAPLRLIVLGRIQLTLPRPPEGQSKVENPAVSLRLDSLGILDFDRSEFSLDASLIDSKIAGMAISGDMALRASWGAAAGFALAVGGFHPRFTPPPAFPTLGRLTLKIVDKPAVRLILQAYLAVTSNSVQLGARLDLHAEAAGFSVDGLLLLDVLIRFRPFGFETDLAAGVVLKKGDRELLVVQVELHLTGPDPWHARGRARFKLWFINGSVPFEGSFGEQRAAEPAPEPPNVKEQLRTALSEPGAWTVTPPAGPLVGLRDAPVATDVILLHPLGSLGVHQSVMPLDVTVRRLGPVVLGGPSRCTVAGLRLGTEPTLITGEPVLDQFAPGEYFELTDDERLSRPGFEPLPAGRRFATGIAVPVDASLGATTDLDYEVSILDAPDRPVRDKHVEALPTDQVLRMAATGPVAVAPARRAGPRRFLAPAPPVVVRPPQFTPVDERGRAAAPGLTGSYTVVREQAGDSVRLAARSEVPS